MTRRDSAEQVSAAVEAIKLAAQDAKQAEDIDELMGHEGIAAKRYFEALESLLPEELGFRGRNKRPPLDVVNSALSYGYAILLGECVSALMAVGLDPAFAFLHKEATDRPALALDVMEEFRPFVVDQVVVALARKGALRASHGTTLKGSRGVWLNRQGKSVLISACEKRMLTRMKGALPDFFGNLRRHLYEQAHRLALTIQFPERLYRGLGWR